MLLFPALDPAATLRLTDEAAHALRQALLPLSQAARRRLDKLDPDAPSARFVVRDVQLTENALAAVSAYHFAAMGERQLATYNVAQLSQALAQTTEAGPGPDWQAIAYRLFERFPYRGPDHPLVARVTAFVNSPALQQRLSWPLEKRQAAALITSHRLPAPDLSDAA